MITIAVCIRRKYEKDDYINCIGHTVSLDNLYVSAKHE